MWYINGNGTRKESGEQGRRGHSVYQNINNVPGTVVAVEVVSNCQILGML